MIISPGNGIPMVGSAGRVQPVRTAGRNPVQAGAERHFDKVTINAGSSFRKELQGRLSREIRTATTTGDIAALRQQVQAGEYQVDAAAIARKMLFAWEV